MKGCEYFDQNACQFVNQLISKVHPWYKIRLIAIEENVITLEVGNVQAIAVRNKHRWRLTSEFTWEQDRTAEMFLDRINQVLAGAKRNDEGELVQC